MRGLFGLWRRSDPVSKGEHELKVYSGAFPAQDVARFLHVGLDGGEAGLVIATAGNAFRIRQALGSSQDKCVFLDAGVELARVMAGERPDGARFNALLGPALREAQRRGNGGVRAYGEMVALLAADGRHQAAVEVEHLWSQLLHGRPVALLCAYPMQVFAGLGQGFLSPIEHEHAVPAGA